MCPSEKNQNFLSVSFITGRFFQIQKHKIISLRENLCFILDCNNHLNDFYDYLGTDLEKA